MVTVEVEWALNEATEDVTAYKIYLKDQMSTHNFVVEDPPFTIEHLANNKTYEIAMTAFNSDGWESDISSWHPVTLTGTSPDGPPDLTIDPDARFTVHGDGLVQMTVKVKNIGEFPAESYTLACYYDALSEENLIASGSYSDLPSQGEQEITFPWDMSTIGICEAKMIYCRVKEVDLPELNETNNIVVIENSMEDVAASLGMRLYTGWNLISFPMEPGNPDIQHVFGPLLAHIKVIWSYDGTWHVYDPESPGFNDLSEIHADRGYWVFVTQSKTVCNLGQDFHTIQLSKGWNLVGFPSKVRISASEALSSITGKVISVWVFDGGEWEVYDPKNPELSDLQFMEPGHGYWINAMDDGTWTLP